MTVRRSYWSIEKDGSIVLRLSSDNGPLGIVGAVRPDTALYRQGGRGFTAIILKPGFPASGPYQQRRQAAQWLQDWVKRAWIKNIVFSEIPALAPREIARARHDAASAGEIA